MSIKSEVNRIKTNVETIRNKLVSFGLAKASDSLNIITTIINNITKTFVEKPAFVTTAYSEDLEIGIRAVNTQAAGYCAGGTNYSETYAALSVDGNVATMTCGGKSISKTVGTFETWVFEMKDGTTVEKVVNVE